MRESSLLEAVLERDRWIVITSLVSVIVMSWIYILMGAGIGMTAFEMTTPALPGTASQTGMAGHDSGMTNPNSMGGAMRTAHGAMMQPAIWTPAYAALMLVMWWVMMMAMMLPSAAPMILLFARIPRQAKDKGAPFVSTGVFASGYLVIWGLFSILAAGTQWGLERVGLLSTMLVSTSGLFTGILLVIAGAYQLTPLKHTCLRHCRNPIQFMSQHWCNGNVGVFRMGLNHGAFCLACCWFLMALLFVGGVMNLYWIVGLAVLVLLEKTMSAGHGLGSAMGVGLMLWGVWILVGIAR